MKHYRYHPNSNYFDGIGLFEEHRDIIEIRNDPKPLYQSWTPIAVHGFDDNPGNEGDFPSLSDYNQLPVFSVRAWDALNPLIGYCCEALPIRYPSDKSYYIIHVMDIIDCVDHERSVVQRYTDGDIMLIERFYLKEEFLVGKHIFKTPRESGADLLVSDEFRKVVEANALKGLLFIPLAMVG